MAPSDRNDLLKMFTEKREKSNPRRAHTVIFSIKILTKV